MPTKEKKNNTKVNISLEENTLATIRALQKQIPAGNLPDMVRYLMLRGIETIQQQGSASKAGK